MNRVSELLVRSKMAITLELKLCLSNISRGIEKQKGYRGANIELSRVQSIYFQYPIFDRFSPIFKKRLTVKALIA